VRLDRNFANRRGDAVRPASTAREKLGNYQRRLGIACVLLISPKRRRLPCQKHRAARAPSRAALPLALYMPVVWKADGGVERGAC
jgi:hypothetical protein